MLACPHANPIIPKSKCFTQFIKKTFISLASITRTLLLSIPGYTYGINSLLWGGWGTGTCWTEQLLMAHSWKCSGPGWMGSWAMWSSERCPWSSWELGPRWSLMSLQIQTILWFFDSVSRACEERKRVQVANSCLFLSLSSSMRPSGFQIINSKFRF